MAAQCQTSARAVPQNLHRDEIALWLCEEVHWNVRMGHIKAILLGVTQTHRVASWQNVSAFRFRCMGEDRENRTAAKHRHENKNRACQEIKTQCDMQSNEHVCSSQPRSCRLIQHKVFSLVNVMELESRPVYLEITKPTSSQQWGVV